MTSQLPASCCRMVWNVLSLVRFFWRVLASPMAPSTLREISALISAIDQERRK